MATPLFTRWFQSQIFSPCFRFRQSGVGAEPWHGPAPAQRVLVDFIRLRRRLTPYINASGTGQGLEPNDPQARLIPATLNDYARASTHLQSLSFGPAFWLQPAPAAAVEMLPVTLPSGRAWIDFWTGASYAGAQVLHTPAPLDLIPTFVRGGSIVPLASVDDKTGEIADPLDIRIYPGADGTFVLQETPALEGDGFPAKISFAWNDHARTLVIGARSGPSLGNSSRRRFNLVVVRPGTAIGHRDPLRPDFSVDYDGAELRLSFPPAPPRPLPPRGLAASIQGENVILTWQAPCENAIYRLKRVRGPGGAYEDIASALSAPRHVLPLASCEGSFDCVVTVMNAGGESAPSAAVRVTVPSASAVSPSPDRQAIPHRAAPASPIRPAYQQSPDKGRVAWPRPQTPLVVGHRRTSTTALSPAALKRIGIITGGAPASHLLAKAG